MVWKLNKVSYGLKQELREWYERLHSYLVKIELSRTSKNNNVYLKNKFENMVLIAEIFVYDIMFGGNDILCKTLSTQMSKEFNMLMFGDYFFIGLKFIKQRIVYMWLNLIM